MGVIPCLPCHILWEDTSSCILLPMICHMLHHLCLSHCVGVTQTKCHLALVMLFLTPLGTVYSLLRASTASAFSFWFRSCPRNSWRTVIDRWPLLSPQPGSPVVWQWASHKHLPALAGRAQEHSAWVVLAIEVRAMKPELGGAKVPG